MVDIKGCNLRGGLKVIVILVQSGSILGEECEL